jgi:hypothetical protein
MKTFIQLSDVKLNNDYTFLKAVAPAITDKAPAYQTGDTWLDTVTGFSYVCIDSLVATWVRIEQAQDVRIVAQKDKTFMNVVRGLNNIFSIERNKNYLDYSGDFYVDFPNGLPQGFTRPKAYTLLAEECIYSKWTFADDGSGIYTITGLIDYIFGSIQDSLKIGDTIYVGGSRRNDGFYTISNIDLTLNEITVAESVIDETSNAFIFLSIVPEEFIMIVARMVWFDIFQRLQSGGLKSESIGSYSFTVGALTALGYPDDIVNGISAYEKMAIGGHSFLVD